MVDEALVRVGLGERADDRYKSYSLGMKQRLAIAATLLKSPDLLILDEPTNGLDPAGIREIRELIRDLGDAGVTVLLSSPHPGRGAAGVHQRDHHRQRPDADVGRGRGPARAYVVPAPRRRPGRSRAPSSRRPA